MSRALHFAPSSHSNCCKGAKIQVPLHAVNWLFFLLHLLTLSPAFEFLSFFVPFIFKWPLWDSDF